MIDFKKDQRIKWTGRNGKERTGVVVENWMYQVIVDEDRFHAKTGKRLATKRAYVWKKNATVIE